jgi:hypothetical protein
MQRFRNYAITCVIALLVFPSTALNQTQDPQAPSTPQKKFYKHDRVIPNRYIVVLNDDVVSSDAPLEVRRAKVTEIADSHAKTYGGKFDYIYESALKGYAIELPNEAAAIAISNLPEVQFVEEDALGTVFGGGVTPPQNNSVCRGKAIPVLELDLSNPKFPGPSQRSLFQGGISQRSRLVIRNRDEFSRFWTETSSYKPAPPEVDFSRDMIVIAAMGQKPTPGYQIFIDGACEVDNHIKVFVRSVDSSRCGLQLGVTSSPVHIVRLPQSQLPVTFQETEFVDCKQSSRP